MHISMPVSDCVRLPCANKQTQQQACLLETERDGTCLFRVTALKHAHDSDICRNLTTTLNNTQPFLTAEQLHIWY